MRKSKNRKNLSAIFTGSLVAVGVSLCVVFTHSARAAGGGSLIAHSQLRRTVDPSPRSAFGTVLAKIDANGKETFQINISELGSTNWGPFVRLEANITTNVASTLPLAPLARTDVHKGKWARSYTGVNQAPADFLSFFGNLNQMADTELAIAQPGVPNAAIIFTNIVGGVTNISLGVTNVVGAVTNIINGVVIPNPGQDGQLFAALWAPLYGLSTTNNSLSYHRKGKLFPVGDASPTASATVNISFNGNTGRSVIKIQAANLTPGQQYSLFVAADTNQPPSVMIPVDNMTQKDLGRKATFVRDTQFGDPLPQQVRDIGDLSGRLIEIRDGFDTVHLAGDMP